jgi:hypothetical protein
MGLPITRHELQNLRNIRNELTNLTNNIIKEILYSAQMTNQRFYVKSNWGNLILNNEMMDEICNLLREKFPDSSIYFLNKDYGLERLVVDWS